MNNTYNKYLKFTSILLIAFICFTLGGQQYAAAQRLSEKDKINIGLIYPLSSNGRNAPRDTNKFSLNLIVGVSAMERGPAIAGITNVVYKNAAGVTIAGFSNHIGQKASGLQLAGVMNTSGQSKGAAVSGLMNSSGDMNGLQFVGFLNLAKNVEGIQFAGFMNSATKVKGSQFAGFINIAKKVSGAQVAGFINIADSSDFSIGIINLIKNGEKSFGVTVDENATFMLSFRSGGRVMYGVIGAGYNTKNDHQQYAFEAGFGAHLLTMGKFRLNAELVSGGLTSFKRGDYFKSTLRLMPAYKLSKSIEIFGGPSLNYVNTDTEEGVELNKKYLHNFSSSGNSNYQVLKLGYTAGLQVHF